MLFLAFLLVLGICLLVISGLIAFAAFVHRSPAGEFTPLDDLLGESDGKNL